MSVKVSDAEVKKSFDEQKKQSFPKDADYKKFLSTSGQTQDDILQRVKLDLLSNKIRDKVVKGKDTVSDKAIEDFYNKNKARFAQPEKRDLRVVLTKDKANAEKAKAALESGDSWKAVAKEHSGAYGMGVDYAYTMVHKAAQRTATTHESLAPVHAPVIER